MTTRRKRTTTTTDTSFWLGDGEQVTISRKEYESLKEDSDTLAKLHAGGVDNWEWYSESLYGDGDDD